jgi:ribosomal protein L37AE/L43A
MSNPFKKISANAKETAKKWDSNKQAATIDSRKCPQCGAPRPVNTDIADCSYCGYKFMEIKVIIKREYTK